MHKNEYKKDFIKHLEKMSARYGIVSVFGDVVAMMACAVGSQFSLDKKAVEARFSAIAGKYTSEEYAEAVNCLVVTMKALEDTRESFLGPILETIGAANVHNGQFFTPASVANVCARICCDDVLKDHKDGELITINDPACGAGAMLISQAEEMLKAGIPQKDIYILAGDIDLRACDITFVELTLLGYAARIDHADALALKELSPSRYTAGYYLHGTQYKEKQNGLLERRD